MNAFSFIISNLIFIVFITGVSIGAYKFYNMCPPAWFIDHGEKISDRPDYRIKARIHIFTFCSIFTFVSYIMFIRFNFSLYLFSGIFTLIFLSFIFVSDLKTGIIPDQFVSALIFISLFWILTDISISGMPPEKWFEYPLMRIAGGVAGGGILLLIGLIGSKLLKQEAMGMGDIKLMFAVGLISGYTGVFAVLILSFLISFPFALLKYLKKLKLPEVLLENKLPFAPFIATSAILYIIFADEVRNLFNWWLAL